MNYVSILTKGFEYEDQPLIGVQVKAQNDKTSVAYQAVTQEMLASLLGRTDANGFVMLPAIQSDPLFSIEMQHKDYCRQTILVDKKQVDAYQRTLTESQNNASSHKRNVQCIRSIGAICIEPMRKRTLAHQSNGLYRLWLVDSGRKRFTILVNMIDPYSNRVIRGEIMVPVENRTRTQCNGTRTRNMRDAITEISTISELAGTSEYEYEYRVAK